MLKRPDANSEEMFLSQLFIISVWKMSEYINGKQFSILKKCRSML